MHKILIGCESSGTVRDAFQERGFDAWSCDIKPSETPTNSHLQMDVRQALREQKWDMLLVCHPPCTMLCNSGVRWLRTPPPGQTLADRWRELKEGARLFRDLMDADIPAIAVENPVMHKHAKNISRALRKFDRVIVDYRTPNQIRIAISPLYNTYNEVFDGFKKVKECVKSKKYLDIGDEFLKVT